MSTEGNKWEPAASHSLLGLFEFQDWQHISDVLGVLQKDMKAALRVAVRQTGQWANREGARGLAKAVNVPLNVLRKGLRIKFKYQSVKGFATARLWYGLNDIAVKYLGAKQTKKGVRARGQTYAGAFISSPMGGNAFQRVGNERLPLRRIDFTIEDKANNFLSEFEKGAADKFVAFFFAALDKSSGRDTGESQSIAGSSSISRT